LTNADGWSYVFANFHAAGRQIDLAVFTAHTALVVEAKGYPLPVHGEINGQWLQHGPYGTKRISNAYNQALSGKNALRDAMHKITQISGYPNAAVVIVPNVPHESRLTNGDYKVAIGGVELIQRLLSRSSGARLAQQQCEALANNLSLESISSTDAALDGVVMRAETLCNAYLAAFMDIYGPYAAELVRDQYECNKREVHFSDVHSLVVKGEHGVVIRGPSGCGKTLLATSCAISCIESGCIPIFVAAKDFSGQFQSLLDREAALFHAQSGISVVSAAKILGKRIVLFLDGYNECLEDFKVRLTRSLWAFTLRYNAGIVVSTQCELARSDLLKFQTIIVRRPSDELKATLAGIEKSEAGAGVFHSLLQVTNSGLEASLVGKVRALLPLRTSRFVLFDTYARMRLKTSATEGIRILSTFANVLAQRVRFSLSVREFERLCDSVELSREARQQLSESRLLQERGDRVSFVHELFFAAFAAEAAMRSANGDLTRIRIVPGSPRFFSSKIFILGAIEDDLLLREVLDACTDQNLIAACARGECGVAAQSIVSCKIQNMLKTMIAEAKGLRFQIDGEGWHGVTIDKSSLCPDLKDFETSVPILLQSDKVSLPVTIMMKS
jgi:hypothetical protein